jgi:hypothetical protein
MAITFDTGLSASNGTGASTVTGALSGAVAGATVVVNVFVESGTAVSATYNSVGMTAAAQRTISSSAAQFVSVIGAVPDTSSHDVIVTLNTVVHASLQISTWLNVASLRTETWASTNGGTGTGLTASVGAMTSAVDEVMVGAAFGGSGTVNLTPNFSVLFGVGTNNTIRFSSQYTVSTATSLTPTWSLDQSVNWAAVALSLQPSAGAAGQPAASRIAHDTPGLAPWSVRRMAGRLYEPSRPLISIPNPRETRAALAGREVCHR